MKKTKILSLVLAFLMMLTSVGVFAEETTETPYQLTESAIELRDNIASAICDTEDVWTAFTMAVYEAYTLGSAKMSDDVKQNILNQAINLAKSDEATAGDRAKIEIVLRSMGIDTKNLYLSGEETPIDNGERLKNAELLASGHYSAPWILLADMQGNTELADEQIENLITVLDANKGTGLFESEWEGITYTDADTASVTVSALARYYGEQDKATQLCDTILEALENNIDENGSFGNANSDAMVIIGLASMGINPYEFRNEITQKSVVDGLLSYANEDNNAFTFYGSENYMATEQGLRALIVLSVFEGEPLNIYDFSHKEVVPGNEIAETPEIPEVPEEPQMPETPEIPEIPEEPQMPETPEIPEVPEEPQMPETPEIPEVPEIPDVPEEPEPEPVIPQTPVYTGGGGSGKNNKKEPKPESEKGTGEEQQELFKADFEDISGHWAYEAICYVSEKGIMNGIGENNFAPDEKLTRGMLVTMLYRLSGDEIKGENSFSDISSDAWYKDAAVWASENNITNGYGNGNFGADDEVTREQLAVFLKRYADLKDARFDKAETEEFNDAQNISSWAKDATLWAKASGILSGRNSGAFDPSAGATRAEIAMVFMRFVENVAKK